MQKNSALIVTLRLVFGAYFIIQGIAQTDLFGKVYFPYLHNHFEEHYTSDYVHSIPWNTMGFNMSARMFRQAVGYTIGISGVILVIGVPLKLATAVMTVVGMWSVYAHLVADDPTYYAVCGGIITLAMAWMTYVPIVAKEKTD